MINISNILIDNNLLKEILKNQETMVDLIQNNKESNHDYNKRSINLILNLEKEIQNLNNKIRKLENQTSGKWWIVSFKYIFINLSKNINIYFIILIRKLS